MTTEVKRRDKETRDRKSVEDKRREEAVIWKTKVKIRIHEPITSSPNQKNNKLGNERLVNSIKIVVKGE